MLFYYGLVPGFWRPSRFPPSAGSTKPTGEAPAGSATLRPGRRRRRRTPEADDDPTNVVPAGCATQSPPRRHASGAGATDPTSQAPAGSAAPSPPRQSALPHQDRPPVPHAPTPSDNPSNPSGHGHGRTSPAHASGRRVDAAGTTEAAADDRPPKARRCLHGPKAAAAAEPAPAPAPAPASAAEEFVRKHEEKLTAYYHQLRGMVLSAAV